MRKRHLNKRKILWFVLMFFIMTLIFCFSNQSTAQSNALSAAVGEIVNITPQHEWQNAGTTPIILGLNLRKLAHVGLYAILGAAAYRLFGKWYLAVLICYGYAVIDEIHQMLIGRNASLSDTFLDAAGSCTAIFLCLIISLVIRAFYHQQSK